MSWKEWPYWLKGGLIPVILGAIYLLGSIIREDAIYGADLMILGGFVLILSFIFAMIGLVIEGIIKHAKK